MRFLGTDDSCLVIYHEQMQGAEGDIYFRKAVPTNPMDRPQITFADAGG